MVRKSPDSNDSTPEDLAALAEEQQVVEPDATDAALEADAEEGEDRPAEPMVRYTGPAGERRVSAADWAERGVTADAAIWGPGNSQAIPKSQFTEEQLRVLSGEPGFEIED